MIDAVDRWQRPQVEIVWLINRLARCCPSRLTSGMVTKIQMKIVDMKTRNQRIAPLQTPAIQPRP
jgi:hypothetical protein